MTERKALSDLIERLEKATGPDRELDVAIGFAVGRIRERDGNYLYATGNDSDMVVEPNEYDDHLVSQPLSYYTASIDAALTLVPEGSWAGLDPIFFDEPGRVLFDAIICRPDWSQWTPAGEWIGRKEARAATPALALCIAALRARLSQENTDGPR